MYEVLIGGPKQKAARPRSQDVSHGPRLVPGQSVYVWPEEGRSGDPTPKGPDALPFTSFLHRGADRPRPTPRVGPRLGWTSPSRVCPGLILGVGKDDVERPAVRFGDPSVLRQICTQHILYVLGVGLYDGTPVFCKVDTTTLCTLRPDRRW